MYYGICLEFLVYEEWRSRCGRDRMVVGFTSAYAISPYHHWCCEFESRSGQGIHHYVIKTCDMSVVFSGSSDFLHHDITEILLKVALNTIKQTNNEESKFLTLSCSSEKCGHIWHSLVLLGWNFKNLLIRSYISKWF